MTVMSGTTCNCWTTCPELIFPTCIQGPTSLFFHRSTKGLDCLLLRLWPAVHLSRQRTILAFLKLSAMQEYFLKRKTSLKSNTPFRRFCIHPNFNEFSARRD